MEASLHSKCNVDIFSFNVSTFYAFSFLFCCVDPRQWSATTENLFMCDNERFIDDDGLSIESVSTNGCGELNRNIFKSTNCPTPLKILMNSLSFKLNQTKACLLFFISLSRSLSGCIEADFIFFCVCDSFFSLLCLSHRIAFSYFY